MLKFLGFVTRKLHKSNKNDGALTFFTDSIFVPYLHLNTTIDNPQINCSALSFVVSARKCITTTLQIAEFFSLFPRKIIFF